MIREELLVKIQAIKQSTKQIMEGGEANAEANTNATADQEQPKQAI